nr:hypothetical protein [Tanacetum cinerariifolium]
MDVEVEQDDLNQKFLTSLALEWLMHTIVWRNRSDLDTMSLDDLYNHLKVYETEVQKKTEPNTQNIAFISSAKHSRANDEVNTASSNVPTVSANVATVSISQETTCAYIASQSSGSQIKFEDINQSLLTASKDLDNRTESQRSDKSKEGLGDTVVPPPAAQLYLSPKKDLSWTGLPECADDTVTDYSRPSPTVESSSEEDQNINPSISGNVASPITPKPFVKKPNKKPNVRGNQRNWNNLKSHQLGLDFVMKKKACFNCGDFNHLAYECRKRCSSKNHIDDKGYWDSGCSRHMIGNISYLSDYEPFDRGYVSFGQGGCKITGKGTIKTGKLEFENVYFVKDLKYNLFSVSQICDNKNSVLFTDSKCIVLGRDFKLLDDDNVLFRTPRHHNMYSIDINNIVPHRDLTCLVAKASADECMIWHRRLGWVEAMQEELLQFKIQKVWSLVDCPKGVRPIRTKWVLKNKKDERGIVIRNKARLVAQGHTQEKGFDYDEVFVPIARIEAIRLFLAYASFMGFTPPRFQDPKYPARVYKVEKAMYGLHQAPRAWYGTLSKYLLTNGFQRGTIDQTLFIRRQRRDFILVQVCVDDIIFGSSNPQLCREFEALVHEKFQMSAMGELNFFIGLSLNTPMDKENPSRKDDTRKDVDLHLYRSMIGSLMYLTASRPDIMFTVYACARHQVTPKEYHLHAVKRIFRYLKGYPKLGLWYPKDSPFDLVAYSDSDYGGATQDHKSTSGGCHFWVEDSFHGNPRSRQL